MAKRRWTFRMIGGRADFPQHEPDSEQAREARRARHNERVKLIATMLNTLAAGTATVGIFGPTVALFLQHPNSPLSSFSLSSELVAFMAIWSLGGLALHLGAHLVIGWLR